jgi:hypothetical protein
MYRNEKDQKAVDKIIKNVLSRQTTYFRRNLAINKIGTNIKVVKVKKTESYLEKFGGLSSIDGDICFVIEHAETFDTFLFNTRVDVVGTDMHQRVIKTFINVSPDNLLEFSKTTCNI